jgi:hypothetical protein
MMTQQLIGLLAMIPDAGWTPHHVCSVENATEGGTKIAVRWRQLASTGSTGSTGSMVGALQRVAQEYAAALASNQAALAIRRRLAEADPKDRSLQRDLASSDEQVGQLQAQ